MWRKTNRPDQPPSHVSVYRWKKRFLESGSDIRALEDAEHSGNNTKRFPAEALEICEQSIDTVYMRRERKHLQDVHTTTGEAAGGRDSGIRPLHGSLRA